MPFIVMQKETPGTLYLSSYNNHIHAYKLEIEIIVGILVSE